MDGFRIKMAISNQTFNKTKCVMILSKCLMTCNRSMQVNQKPWPTTPSHHYLEKQTNNQERFWKFSPTLPNQILLGQEGDDDHVYINMYIYIYLFIEGSTSHKSMLYLFNIHKFHDMTLCTSSHVRQDACEGWPQQSFGQTSNHVNFIFR